MFASRIKIYPFVIRIHIVLRVMIIIRLIAVLVFEFKIPFRIAGASASRSTLSTDAIITQTCI